jgi:predicted alpha/beta-fold hydrolase
MVIERIRNKKPKLFNHMITNNLTNKFKTTEVKLALPTKFPIKIESHIKKFNQF